MTKLHQEKKLTFTFTQDICAKKYKTQNVRKAKTLTNTNVLKMTKLYKGTPPKLYRDKTLTQDICAAKDNYYYKTRSVTNAIANANANTNADANANINPNVLKYHKYIPHLENSISSVRKNLNSKNLKIKIP